MTHDGFSIRRLRQLDDFDLGVNTGTSGALASGRVPDDDDDAAKESPGPRPEVLRLWLDAELGLSGFTLNAALATVKGGRPAHATRGMNDALSRAVASLRDRGITRAKIGLALGGKGDQTVANLEARGRALRGVEEIVEEVVEELAASVPLPKAPCHKHVEYIADCPACVRANRIEGAHVLYTDGACSQNPGPGGWSWVLVRDGTFVAEGSGFDPSATNNRMEIVAVIQGLFALEDDGLDITIVSDSKYVIDCLAQRWYERWRSNGWRTAAGKDVANRDLWEALLAVYETRTGLTSFEHVKGHDGHEWNERCDSLAVTAAGSSGRRK